MLYNKSILDLFSLLNLLESLMERFENWMSYSYDGVEYGRKKVDTKEFTININKKKSKPLPSYKYALLNHAKIMREMYNEPFDVC